MTRILSFLLLFTLLLSASPARAQAEPALAELEIALWPEYDRSAMLIIYRGTLSADTTLPASLTFTIPAQYGPPFAVAYTDAQGQLLNLEYTTAVSGDAMLIAFDAPTRNFQFEYYDTGLDLSSATRRYGFGAAVAYPVQTLTLEVQQPIGASGLTAKPAMSGSRLGSDGLTYFSSVRTNVAANEAITLELTYQKSDNMLTAASGPQVFATPELPPPASAGSLPDATIILAVVAGVFGIGLVGAGVMLFARSRSADAADAHAPRTVQQRKMEEAGSSAEDEIPSAPAAYCHECGQPVRPEDRFCRNCGTKLRR